MLNDTAIKSRRDCQIKQPVTRRAIFIIHLFYKIGKKAVSIRIVIISIEVIKLFNKFIPDGFMQRSCPGKFMKRTFNLFPECIMGHFTTAGTDHEETFRQKMLDVKVI
jgi:hypothetical protein